MLKLSNLNAQLKKLDSNLILRKGEGYFYFVYSDGNQFETKSVMVYRLNELTETQWIKEANRFLENWL